MRIIFPSSDSKKVGQAPQLVAADPKLDRPTIPPSAVRKKKIPSDAEFSVYHLLPKAKMVDCLFGGAFSYPYQLVASEKLLSILSQMQGQSFETKEITIMDQNSQVHEYHLVNYTEPLSNDIVVLSNSRVKSYNYSTHKYESVTVNSVEELRSLNGAEFKTVALDETSVKNLHHFVAPIVFRWIVSNELVDEMINQSITGLTAFEFDAEVDISLKNISSLNSLI